MHYSPGSFCSATISADAAACPCAFAADTSASLAAVAAASHMVPTAATSFAYYGAECGAKAAIFAVARVAGAHDGRSKDYPRTVHWIAGSDCPSTIHGRSAGGPIAYGQSTVGQSTIPDVRDPQQSKQDLRTVHRLYYFTSSMSTVALNIMFCNLFCYF